MGQSDTDDLDLGESEERISHSSELGGEKKLEELNSGKTHGTNESSTACGVFVHYNQVNVWKNPYRAVNRGSLWDVGLEKRRKNHFISHSAHFYHDQELHLK